ncbi:protein ACCELERATED CELL DEATH 6-like [Daucus carota subsp. sativus]|uniref:protein ACCELERATED CELL DEATH 6-like n=1 Tax=Daucus carota subsp. sativus TaxID=79200 RepID=UPI003083948B
MSLPRAWKQNLLEANSIAKDALRKLIYAAKRSTSNSEDASDDNDSFEAILDKTYDEMTILELAVSQNYTEVAELILAEHPAYKRELGVSSSNLSDLIGKAAHNGFRDMVILLSETYEILNATDKGQTEITNVGLHAFLVAIRVRSRDFVVRLLEENPSVVTYVDKDGWKWKPLHHAVFQEFDSILEVIIKAHIRISDHISEDDRIKAFLIAVLDANTSTLIQLIKLLRGDEPYPVVNIHGETLLHLAVAKHKIEMIQCMLKHCPLEHVDAMLNQQDADGNTPLHLLIWSGCFVPEVIKHKSCQKVVQNRGSWTQADMLYFSDDIIVDQVQIKEALDEIQESKRSWIWFWRKPDMPYHEVTKERRSKKDEKFKEAKKELIARRREKMKEEVQGYRSRTNTQIIVTALITTVTFTVGFTMPGGYHQSGEPEQGLILLSKRKAFKTFMISDALALALSLTSLFIYFISSMNDDPVRVR